MNKSVYEELCREETELVERLRVLREFKDKFFTSLIPQNQPTVSNIIPENNTEPKKTVLKKPVRRTKKPGVKRITVGLFYS